MKKLYGFISLKLVLLILLMVYIVRLGNVFYTTILLINRTYSDSYNKIIDENHKISEIKRIKDKNDYEKYDLSIEGIIGKEKNINTFDFENDDSLQKFITSNKSFNNKKYVPNDLVSISSKFIVDTKGGTQLLRKIANENLHLMAEKFNKDFSEKIVVVSAYRSYDYQIGIKSRGCPDNLCAKAGFSEHQSGMAVDLWEASTNNNWKTNKKLKKYYDWLNQNAHNFGFHNTYQKGLNIDGYEIEPWHWRYLGVDLATYLKENNLTIAEYYNNNLKWQ